MRAVDIAARYSLRPEQRRSGSERRQRNAPVSVRLLPAERAAIAVKAAEAELTIAGYLRACALGDAGPRTRRGRPVNAAVLAQAIATLNSVGSTLSAIARVPGAAGAVDGDLAQTLALVRDGIGVVVATINGKAAP